MADIVTIVDSDDDALQIVEDDNIEDDEDCSDQSNEPASSPDQGLAAPIELVIDKTKSSTKHPFRYKCPFCFKFYTSRSGLTSHKNSVHYKAKPYRFVIEALFLLW